MTTAVGSSGAQKEAVQKSVSANADALLDLSHRIHAHPELGFEETKASQWVADILRNNGFNVEPGVAGLPTSFVATVGSGSLNVGICAEYDALGGVGHACGHNIIASAAVGAALALAPLADELDITVTVLGTPAEEGGGGKIFMLQRGAFDGLNAAMMVHAAPIERDAMATLANARFMVNFKGKAAHAAAAPERGINAGSALALGQMGIGMLREHLLKTDRVHGIVRHGGDAMNVIPERTKGEWCTRAATIERHNTVFARTVDVFKGAALMTGCELEIAKTGPLFADVRTDHDMAALWRTNAAALGRESTPIQPTDGYASTDMGNVSYAIPSIHPLIAIDSNGANIHEAEFAHHAAEATGDKAVLDGATALAYTAIDMAQPGPLRDRLLERSYAVANEPGNVDYLDTDFDQTISFKP